MPSTKTPADWFHLAERAYLQQHQGCAWCGGAYRVHAACRGSKHVFNCQRCDFQVSFDAQTERYHMVPGEEMSVGMDTMLEQPIANLL